MESVQCIPIANFLAESLLLIELLDICKCTLLLLPPGDANLLKHIILYRRYLDNELSS
jgi:hypothetical protein